SRGRSWHCSAPFSSPLDSWSRIVALCHPARTLAAVLSLHAANLNRSVSTSRPGLIDLPGLPRLGFIDAADLFSKWVSNGFVARCAQGGHLDVSVWEVEVGVVA